MSVSVLPSGSIGWVCAEGMGGGGLYGCFGEQELPIGVQECIERFHRGFVDYLSRKFVPKWDSPNCEGEFATAGTTSLLVELTNMAA